MQENETVQHWLDRTLPRVALDKSDSMRDDGPGVAEFDDDWLDELA